MSYLKASNVYWNWKINCGIFNFETFGPMCVQKCIKMSFPDIYLCVPFFEACLITWVFNLNLQPPTESRTASFYFDEYLMQKLHFFITKYNLFGRLVKHIRNWMSGNLRCLIFICPLMSYEEVPNLFLKNTSRSAVSLLFTPLVFKRLLIKIKDSHKTLVILRYFRMCKKICVDPANPLIDRKCHRRNSSFISLVISQLRNLVKLTL